MLYTFNIINIYYILVFDNLHPNGIPYTEWYEDLGGEVYFKCSMIIKIMSSW